MPPLVSRAQRHGWQPVDPPRRGVLFINPRSGGGRAAHWSLADRAREKGVEPVVLGPGDDLAALAVSAAENGADALGMAGGDGSLAPVAAVAATHDLPFVCLPAGTRNHFALDVGVVRHDLIGALDAFTTGLERRVDLAEVNGRAFLNNVSLGVYGDAIQQPGYREAKLRTMLKTINEVLSSTLSTPGLRITDNQGRDHTSPVVVLVSNNPYALHHPLVRGSRPRLDTGRLGVAVVERPVAQSSPVPAPGEAPPVSVWSASEVEIAGAATLAAGLDGEAAVLEPPLLCTSRHAALRVRISSNHPGLSPSALVSVR